MQLWLSGNYFEEEVIAIGYGLLACMFATLVSSLLFLLLFGDCKYAFNTNHSTSH